MAKRILEGMAFAPGVANAPVFIIENSEQEDKRPISQEEIPLELEALSAASRKVYEDFKSRLESLPEEMEESRDLVSAQMVLSRDPRIIEGAMSRIVMRKISASWALAETIEELVSLFRDISDSSVMDRIQDIQAIGSCLRQALSQSSQASHPKGILAVPSLSPMLILGLKNQAVKAIVTEDGGLTTHAAILAKSLKIPVIINLQGLLKSIHNGQNLLVDGYAGKIFIEPSGEEVKKLTDRSEKIIRDGEYMRLHAAEPAHTLDGEVIETLANLEISSQMTVFRNSGAEGVGLYRTEFAFLQGKLPAEDDLTREYVKVVNNAPKGKIVFRTLDIGADKIIDESWNIEEENPALGLRGIRFCLKRRDLFKMQLRAILRACKKRPASIMLPMISNLNEFFLARQLLREEHKKLEKEGVEHHFPLRLGIMIETPAAMLIADKLAAYCDFFSIGTNDLLHYLLAIDRSNRHVAYLNNPFHPAFLKAIQHILKHAKNHGLPVSVCGELASDPGGIILLLGLGVRILSATPLLIPALKHLLRNLDTGECEKVVENALKKDNPRMLKKQVQKILEKASISVADFPLKSPLLAQMASRNF